MCQWEENKCKQRFQSANFLFYNDFVVQCPLINYTDKFIWKKYFPKGALIVKLCDEFPDGQTRLISFGVLNLTHYKSDEKPEQLRTGNW